MAKGNSGGFGKFLLGFLFALVVAAVGLWGYLRFGSVPVAVADPGWTWEHEVTHTALDARITRELKKPPFGTSEDVFESGAKLYRENCAACHGVPGKPSPFAKEMYPKAPQLWVKNPHNASVVGVSDDEVGESYWKVENGIRLTGMPSFKGRLSETQMWQITLLVKNADQQLPDPVMKLLMQPQLP